MLPLTVDDLIYLLEGAQDTVIEVKTDSGKTFYISNLRIPTDGGRVTLHVKEYTDEMTEYLKEIKNVS